MERLPRNQIHPTWEGSESPQAFEVLARGIEHERARLLGMPFITVKYGIELDYDGEEESLQLLEGFSDETSAIQYVATQMTQALRETTADSSMGYSSHVTQGDERIKPCQESALVRSICLKSFEVTRETGGYVFLKKYQFEVLYANLPQGIGPTLFVFYDAQDEWLRYFRSIGRKCDAGL